MFPEPQLSTREVFLMVITYSILYHSKYEARDSLFDPDSKRLSSTCRQLK